MRCLSWFRWNRDKLNSSPADFWVFVLHAFKSKGPDFVVVPRDELQQRMTKLHSDGTLQVYFCSTGSNCCWETRDLGDDTPQIEEGARNEPLRDFTQYLNANGWAAIVKKLER
jgi:hypothetical protein